MTGETTGDDWQGWRAATEAALYGPHGFYRSPEGPAAHFRTSVHASPLFADAVARLLCRVDEALSHPARLDFVDMAAGRGELVTGVLAALPAEVSARVRAYAVERADRPAGLDARIQWLPEPPRGITGLLFANEWLDNVPLDITEVDSRGMARRVLVRRDGTERLGEEIGGAEAQWLARWWPWGGPEGLGGGSHAEGSRAEIGLPRDEAWADAVSSLDRGLAVAVDYAHTLDSRPPFGTLTGFRAGHETSPVPDGSCDITAHVALDACAAHGEAALAARGEATGGEAAREAWGEAARECPNPGACGSHEGAERGPRTARGDASPGAHEGCEDVESAAHTARAGADPGPRTARREGAEVEAHAARGDEEPGAPLVDRRAAPGAHGGGEQTARTASGGGEQAAREGVGAGPRTVGGGAEVGTCGAWAEVDHGVCAACSAARGVPRARLLRQRDALRALGISGARPPLSLASSQPAAYVRALASAGEAAELTAPGGLGDFGWLLQPVGIADALID